MAKASTTKINKDLESALKYAKQLETLIGKISGTGAGSNGMSTSLGRVAGWAGSNAGNILSGVGQVVGAGYNMMPQLQDVVSRSTAFYNASLLQGGRFSQTQMYNNLRAGLGKFGIQDKMSTAILAQGYGERGVVFGSQYANQLTSAVGGAVKYLNMDTQRAFSALEGLTAGAGGQSSNLLRTMGIFTSNPYTGREYSQQQIFEQIHSRIAAGRSPASVEDVQNSYRRGMLGAFLKDSGMTPDQQQMYYMWELAKAGGVKMDLGDKSSMDAAMKQLKIRNPQLDLNAIQASEETVLQAGTDSMLGGLKNSVGTIEALNVAAAKLTETFGGLKAYLDSVTSTRAGGAVGDLAGTALSAGSSALGSYLGVKALGLGPAGGAGSMTRGVTSAVKGIGAVGAVASGVTAAVGGYSAGAAGTAYNPWDNFLGGFTAGAMIGGTSGAAAMGIGAIPGALIGGLIGGFGAVGIGAASNAIGSAGRGGPKDVKAGKGSTTPTTADTAERRASFHWKKPTSGTVTSEFGKRVAPTAGASTNHQGIDIANSSGTPVYAAGDGKVLSVSRSASGYGNRVRIYHPKASINGKTVTTGYAHLSSISVAPGKTVKAGDRIGSMGQSGVATGPHLHFDAAHGRGGENYFNPRRLGIGFGGSAGPGSGGKPNAVAAGNNSAGNSPTTTAAAGNWLTPNGFPGSSAGAASIGTSGSNNYGIQTVDYLSGPGSVGNIWGSSSGALLYTPGAEKNGQSSSSADNATSGQGGPATVGEIGSASGMTPTSAVGTNPRGKSGGNNITINLTVAKASDSEARRFANVVKQMLESDSDIMEMGKR